MDTVRCNTNSFHIQLLMNVIDMDRFPFVKMVIEKKITETEYEEIFQLLQMLNEKYKQQKEDGLMNFTSLLVHFAGMLNDKLDPNATIVALKKEGYFTELMIEFLHLIKKGKRIHKDGKYV